MCGHSLYCGFSRKKGVGQFSKDERGKQVEDWLVRKLGASSGIEEWPKMF